MNSDATQALADDLLTFIEQREAAQIAYGVYDVTMTGAEVLAGYRPVDVTRVPLVDRERALKEALCWLAAEVLIIRFDTADDPAEWVFRSRIAEMVRLIALVRQRIVWHGGAGAKQSHRLSSSKRLVADTTLTVMARLVPRRDQPTSGMLRTLLAANVEQQQVADLLLTVIDQALPKLRMISGFQQRASAAILKALRLDERGTGLRGVVVTAGTGAGKTYAFFLPVLAHAVLTRCLHGQVGVKAICIYPRVALSENQLADFIEILFHLNQALAAAELPPLTIGIESGAALYNRNDFARALRSKDEQEKFARMRGWVYDEAAAGFRAPFAHCVGSEGYACATSEVRLVARQDDPVTLVCPCCDVHYPFIQFVRENVMEAHPPDILVATTESLNRRLLSSKMQYLFGTAKFCAPSVVMLDEIHLQASTAGTQVALLLRRLLARLRAGKLARHECDRIAFIGLSATIAQPVQFIATLAGIAPEHVVEVRPADDEMQVIGAERFIFVRATEQEDVATISTLIQTTMAALHTMPQPPSGSPLARYRAFGFVQSLDVVGRWLYQIEDAERMRPWQREATARDEQAGIAMHDRKISDVPLYAYRWPPHNRKLFPRLLGNTPIPDCGCEQRHGPDLTCPLFQAGECWWVVSQAGKARQEALKIRRKSASDRDKPIEPDDDLIITTSALEVGYDDDALMCVIQYGAPANIASFVQRKGRGGRQVGTRPIVITLLSPYSSAEIFLFRNQHLLTEPIFRKLPLNTQNRFLQRIHGFYAIMDWLAYSANLEGRHYQLEQLDERALNLLKERGEDSATLLALKDYLGRAFSLDGPDAAELLAGSDGILLNHYLRLVRTLTIRLQAADSPRYGVNGRDLVRDLLPENLFSDLNLPEVRVRYSQSYPTTESIGLALATTVPGNVSFRGGFGSTWIPPIVSETDDVPRLVIADYYEVVALDEKANVKSLPMRALRMAGIDPDQTKTLSIFRPSAITPTPFSKDHNSSLWYGDPATGELQQHDRRDAAGQHECMLAHASSGFPISAIEIRAEREDLPTAFWLRPGHPTLRADPLGERLTHQLLLYSDEANNQNPIDVRLLTLGSQFSLVFHEHRADTIEGVVGFTADSGYAEPCLLGYQMTTEGLALDLAQLHLERLRIEPPVAAQLCYTATRHAAITALMVEHGANIFAAGHLVDLLLTIADERRIAQGESPAVVAAWLTAGGPGVSHAMQRMISEVYCLSKRKTEAAQALAERPEVIESFANIYAEVAAGGALYHDYLHDTFKYSLAQALKQTAQELAGVEALRYIGAYTKLHVDFGSRATDRIWLYEVGMGGIGVMRATHEALRSEPDRFWATLAQRMARCPTAQEEALLRHVLAQPEDWLVVCDTLAEQVRTARGAKQRQQAIEDLLAEVRRHLGLIIQQEHAKALMRLFVPDYLEQAHGATLSNWRLYREINTLFLPNCTVRLGREPSFAEVRGLLYHEITGANAASYPHLALLLEIYRAEYDTDAAACREAFAIAVDRRLLSSCRCSCPSCLNDRGGQETPSLGWMLLSRPLLTAWLNATRAEHTLTIASGDDLSALRDRLRILLERGARSLYLQVAAGQLTALCKAVSYLTDAGIDTHYGMVYPMLTDIATIFTADPTAAPLVSLTIRPIL
ncbi:DEAD/DEAH box helicase [Candidatus Viridilinea mediisalina]|nr:DEAD/DEAH box helicase [Candidatus Viridilinea mediisalina]